MANLRVISVSVIDSTTLTASFTHDLDEFINTSNITISSNVPGVLDLAVLKVVVSGSNLKITTRPATPYASYFVSFQSTQTTPFKSKDGSAYLFEDGKTNVKLILGAEDPEDSVRDMLIDYLKYNVFSLENGTLVRDIVNSQAIVVSKRREREF